MKKFLYILTLCCSIAPNMAYSAAGGEGRTDDEIIDHRKEGLKYIVAGTAGSVLSGAVFAMSLIPEKATDLVNFIRPQRAARLSGPESHDHLIEYDRNLFNQDVQSIRGWSGIAGVVGCTYSLASIYKGIKQAYWGNQYYAYEFYHRMHGRFTWEDALRLRNFQRPENIFEQLTRRRYSSNNRKIRAFLDTLPVESDVDALMPSEMERYVHTFRLLRGHTQTRSRRTVFDLENILRRRGAEMPAEDVYRSIRLRGILGKPDFTREERNLLNLYKSDLIRRGNAAFGEQRREERERREAEERAEELRSLRSSREKWTSGRPLTDQDRAEMAMAALRGGFSLFFGDEQDAEMASAAREAAATGLMRLAFGDSDEARSLAGPLLAAATDEQLRAGLTIVGVGAVAIVAQMFQDGEIEEDIEDGDGEDPLNPDRPVRPLRPQEANMFTDMPFLENLYTNGVRNADGVWVVHPNDLRIFLVGNIELLTLERVQYMESPEFIADVAARGGDWQGVLRHKYPDVFDHEVDEEHAEEAPEEGAAGPGGALPEAAENALEDQGDGLEEDGIRRRRSGA